MNRKQLEKEGQKWVTDKIISEQQLETILNQYTKEDKSYLLVILAALLISISVLVFIFSDWAQIPNISRIIIMLLMMFTFYATGFYYERKDDHTNNKQKDMQSQSYSRSQIIGISLIILAYITFGASLLLTLYMYDVQLTSAWPFILWSLVGIVLYVMVPNRYLFTIALLITLYGQVHSSFSYASFNFIIFVLFFFVYFHYVYHRGYKIIHYIFSLGLVLQILLLTINNFSNYYWFMFFLLVIFGLSIILPNKQLKNKMMCITVITLLFYKMYESLIVQESYTMDSLSFQLSFFILHFIVLLGVALLLIIFNRKELITLILFIPLFYLPNAHILIIVSLFIYSIYWLVYSFQKDINSKIMLGLFSFFLSIFTVIIQFTWETINKSLFFLIAGLILFAISVLLERRRRRDEGSAS